MYVYIMMSLYISVGIVTRLKAAQPRNRGSVPSTGKMFDSSLEINVGAGVHLASHSRGIRALCTEIKQSEREGDHRSPPSNVEVKKNSTPLNVFMVWPRAILPVRLVPW
jgi:hypothetical protein